MARAAVGGSHSVILDSAGCVWTVGRGHEGQLGHDSRENSSSLTKVDGLPPCVMVAAGLSFTACLCANGQLYNFGVNHHGQLGQGHKENLITPHLVEGLPPIRTIACGGNHTICVDEDSCVWSFGLNNNGQLGLGHKEAIVTTPCRVENLVVDQVACGEAHTLALSTDGTLYSWGSGKYGQLGRNVPGGVCLLPMPLRVPFTPHSIHCGGEYSIIKDTEGGLWSAGRGSKGELGHGNTHGRSKFRRIPQFVSTQVACGYHHVVAIDDQSRLWGWGNVTPNATSPTLLREGVSVALAGPFQTVVKTIDDQVLACGLNRYGELGGGTLSDDCSWVQTAIPPEAVVYGALDSKRPKSARSAVAYDPEK